MIAIAKWQYYKKNKTDVLFSTESGISHDFIFLITSLLTSSGQVQSQQHSTNTTALFKAGGEIHLFKYLSAAAY